MVFRCTCCNEFVDENPQLVNGFCEFAYDGFEWLEVGESVPPLDERIWTRSESVPIVGEKRFLKVSAPFNQDFGDRFNMLFSPALSALNGWDDYPEELFDSAVVVCTFEKVVHADEYRAWIEVAIKDVIPLKDLHKHYPRVETDDVIGYGFELKLDFRHKCWEFYSFSAQGDFGEWQLVYVDNEGLRHIILIGEYSMHKDFVCCGNVINIGKAQVFNGRLV